MSDFNNDLAENMKNPEFAYEYGRTERELEIIQLAKDLEHKSMTHSTLCTREHYFVAKLIAAIKGENVQEPSVSANRGQAEFTDKG